MNYQSTIAQSNAVSYRHFIWNEIINRKLILWGIGLSIAQFILFKIFYPFPDFISDSYSYIFAAYAHLNISIWPIGYSKFLDYFHRITSSDNALIAVQYFSVQMAVLHFYFTILYFFHTSLWTRKAAYLFLVINPLTLYICNTVNSDALFAFLSLLWITQLIWIIYRPRMYQILIQAFLLFLCFTVRNNAYYYPIVATFAFALSKQDWKLKATGILFPFFVLIPFILYTRAEAYKLTGSKQFSLFTGWQLANNALYIYDQVDIDSTMFVTSEAKELNRMAAAFIKGNNPLAYRRYLESFEGNFFIKYSGAPLKQYYYHHYNPKSRIGGVRDWGKASIVFESFGMPIIQHYPFAYLHYFMLPNTLHYFLPPLLQLATYNYGTNEIEPIAKAWFQYSSPKVHCISYNLQELLILYEAFFLLINLFFIWQLIRSIRILGSKPPANDHISSIIVAISFLLCNFCFSIFATVNIIRYQFFPMFILLVFGCLINDYLQYFMMDKSLIKDKSSSLKSYQLSIENKA